MYLKIMKKLNKKALFIIILTIFIFIPFLTFSASNEGFIDSLTPDNNFYFLKTFKERISLIMTLDPQKKIEKAFAFSKEKLNEAKKMMNVNNRQAANKAIDLYRYYVGLIYEISDKKAIDITKIKQKLAKYTENEAVQNMYKNLPPPNKSSLKEFFQRGANAFKRIFLFLIELIFKIKDFLKNLISKL